MVKATVDNATAAARDKAKVDAGRTSFVGTRLKLQVVAFNHFVGSLPLCRHKTLVEVKEFEDPLANADYVDADQG